MNTSGFIHEKRITSVELFQVDVTVPRHFSTGNWHTRQHVFIHAEAGDHSAWTELLAAYNEPGFDLQSWSAPFRFLSGQSIGDISTALNVSHTQWPVPVREAIELLLTDLELRIAGTAYLDVAGSLSLSSIPALFCILENEPAKVAERCAIAAQRGYSQVKLKLFGDSDLDCEILSRARDVLGFDIYIMGDANEGYGGNTATISSLARQLLHLHDRGLDACEDPARLTPGEWVKLQELVGGLVLIPDYPLRPAWAALKTVVPGMGRCYNIHPGCCGSLSAAQALSDRITGFGADVMIGDDSLVGPGCAVWQQIALGLGAVRVEALEKPDESDMYQQCLLTSPVSQTEDGMIELTESLPGFGIELDTDKLQELSTDYRLL